MPASTAARLLEARAYPTRPRADAEAAIERIRRRRDFRSGGAVALGRRESGAPKRRRDAYVVANETRRPDSPLARTC